MTVAAGPSPAEVARTAIARARGGTLVCRGCATPDSMTLVQVSDQPDGHPLVHLRGTSPVARWLARRPLVTTAVAAPGPWDALHLTGRASRVEDQRPGRHTFRIDLLNARLVTRQPTDAPRWVPLQDYLAAAPDPLWPHADQVLAHLDEAHAIELLACARAHGLAHAGAVVPRVLDRFGLSLAVIAADGVTAVRLPFPGGPVDSLDQVGCGIRALMTCRCHGRD